jgi:hypothetical protein
VGQTVIVKKTKTTFQRGYHRRYNLELFTISKVDTRKPIPMYELKSVSAAICFVYIFFVYISCVIIAIHNESFDNFFSFRSFIQQVSKKDTIKGFFYESEIQAIDRSSGIYRFVTLGRRVNKGVRQIKAWFEGHEKSKAKWVNVDDLFTI